MAQQPSEELQIVEQCSLPVVVPEGSVYAWKRTSGTYRILKWEWLVDPSDPQDKLAATASILLEVNEEPKPFQTGNFRKPATIETFARHDKL